jgi:hypothetical protein
VPKIKAFCRSNFLKSTERSDTIILGILGILGNLDILGISHLGILGTLDILGIFKYPG